MLPDTEWERRFGYPSKKVAGVDEVGRGCLAGPVVAGAVLLPEFDEGHAPFWLRTVTDSKLLSPDQREELFPRIVDWVFAYGIGIAEVGEVDRLNIHHASHLAMARAVSDLGQGSSILPDHLLIDGKFIPKGLPAPATALVKGDQRSLSIACASILAKVWRDRHMVELDLRYPGYGLATHKGYPTPAHVEALKRQGVSEIHRRSFGPVARLCFSDPKSESRTTT